MNILGFSGHIVLQPESSHKAGSGVWGETTGGGQANKVTVSSQSLGPATGTSILLGLLSSMCEEPLSTRSCPLLVKSCPWHITSPILSHCVWVSPWAGSQTHPVSNHTLQWHETGHSSNGQVKGGLREYKIGHQRYLIQLHS